jgi:hypothetical protein
VSEWLSVCSGQKEDRVTDHDLWEVRALPTGLSLELHGGGDPALVLAQGENRVRVELAQVKSLMAALADAAADLAELLAGGGVYHA